jgi:hypothetical protein
MFSRCQGGGGGGGDDVAGVGPGSNTANVYRTNSFNPLSLTLTFGQGCKECSSSLPSP